MMVVTAVMVTMTEVTMAMVSMMMMMMMIAGEEWVGVAKPRSTSS